MFQKNINLLLTFSYADGRNNNPWLETGQAIDKFGKGRVFAVGNAAGGDGASIADRQEITAGVFLVTF